MTQKQEREVGSGESELYRLASPEFARELRRKALCAGLLGIVLSLVAIIAGIDGMRTGQLVRFGAIFSGPDLPGSLVKLIGLFLLCLTGMMLWRNVIRPR